MRLPDIDQRPGRFDERGADPDVQAQIRLHGGGDLVQRGEIDKAVSLLSGAKDLADNETIKQNWEHLANGRVKKFSNAGFGEEWYALLLEEPKAGKQKMQRAF